MGIYLYLIDNYDEVLEQLHISSITRRIKSERFHNLLYDNLNTDTIQELADIIKVEIPDYKDCFNEAQASRAVVLLECAAYCNYKIEFV